MKRSFVGWLPLALVVLALPRVAGADPWADAVISYLPGINPDMGYTTAAASLGEPTRYTNPTHPFGGVVTPLNPSWATDETVSIGAGGHLIVRFDEPVTNHPANPFGVDLIVFGNSFFTGNFFGGPPDFAYNPSGTVSGVSADGGVIEISGDGVNFFPVSGAADGLYPTNGYADIAEPFTTVRGSVKARFTLPVDPAFNPNGKTFAQVIAGYEGSGGGWGVDIGAAGLSSVSYVRVTNPAGSSITPDIDAFADVAPVPEPAAGALILFLFGAAPFAWQFRKLR
jgi:hypothetical protein